MIIVVEGISACGKSTWCAQHGEPFIIPENGRIVNAPAPAAAARFWAECNAVRWRAALAMETASALAVCDTDPLKLHYTWGLWQVGEASEQAWQAELAATRETFAQGRIGFADRYFVKSIEPDVARRQKTADVTRSRRNFELHLRLQPGLLAWYQALASVLPDRVQFQFPEGFQRCAVSRDRYDLAMFDRFVAALPTL